MWAFNFDGFSSLVLNKCFIDDTMHSSFVSSQGVERDTYATMLASAIGWKIANVVVDPHVLFEGML